MLTSFGTFWGGEGLGIEWWHEDLFLLVLVAFYLAVALALIALLRPYAPPKVAPTLEDLENPIASEVTE
jgi:uncharacterized membrane protein